MKPIAWLKRWQEPVVWLPLIVMLALAAWLVLGALDPGSTVDLIARLIELPITTAYAVAALALTWLARRRQRRKLTAEQEDELWRRVLAGERGALFVYTLDVVVWLACAFLLLRFFLR